MGGGWGNCVVCKISGKMLFKLKKESHFGSTNNQLGIIGSSHFNPMKRHYGSFLGTISFYHDAGSDGFNTSQLLYYG